MTETSTMLSSTILTSKTSDVSVGLFKSFVDYLKRVCQSLLISLFESPIDIDELFNKQSSINAIKQFINHGDCQTLCISRKNFNRKSSTVDLPDETLDYQNTKMLSSDDFDISIKMESVDSKKLSLVIVKSTLLFENNHSFNDQMLVITFMNSNPIETLYKYISCVLKPYVKICAHHLDLKHLKHVDMLLSLEKNLQAVESDLMIMKNTDMAIIESQCKYDNDFDHNMVLLELMFTNVLDNNCRAHVYDALLSYSVISDSVVRQGDENITIRPISNPANAFMPFETFSISFECDIAFFMCQGYLRRTYSNYGHIMTLNKPTYLAQDIVV